MKKYIQGFMRYRYLLKELVYKGIKIIFRFSVDTVGTITYNNGISICIWWTVRKQSSLLPGIYFMR